LLLAYTAVAAAATAAVVDRNPMGTQVGPGWTLSLLLLGMLVLAVLVQADSPGGGNAFWATLPLRPSAVASAKVLVAALVIVGIPLVGQTAALAAHDVAVGDPPGLLLDSVVSYGFWLAAAAVVAALTPDLRTFIVAFALAAIGSTIALTALMSILDRSVDEFASLPRLLQAVEVAGLLLLLAHLYRTRDVRRGAWVAGLFGAVLLLAPAALPRSQPGAGVGPVPAHLRPAVLEIEEVRPIPGGAEVQLDVRLVGGSERHEYVLKEPVVRFVTQGGSSETVELEHSYSLAGAPSRVLDGLRWFGERGPAPPTTSAIQVEPSRAQREALVAGRAALELRGRLEVRELRVWADLPLETGATAASAGRRVAVVGVSEAAHGPVVDLWTSAVASSRSATNPLEYGDVWGSRAYALVNRARGEALALTAAGGSGIGLGLVLPGPDTREFTFKLEPRRFGPSFGLLDEGWRRDARLVLLEWVPVGSDPVRLRPEPSHLRR
ncbi:MAG TPA: hypothetical protein VHG51_17690, partial [Longimicrobiaceae bacterium]|nr:hypothetical protein [Longimicrobiaceae bacterium]